MIEKGNRTRGVLAAWRGNGDLHVCLLVNAATRGRVGYGIANRSSQTLPRYHKRKAGAIRGFQTNGTTGEDGTKGEGET